MPLNSFARVAAASVRVHLGDIEANEREIAAAMERLAARGVQLAVFPELCLTGYTLGDLLLHEQVRERALAALLRLAAQTSEMAVAVGLPFCADGRLFNCAAVLQAGRVRGLVPKTYLPGGSEFYETRWFVSGEQARGDALLVGERVPFQPGLLFEAGRFCFAAEICEDLWSPTPPSVRYAVAGADVIVNLSASNALVGKHAYRRQLLSQHSARLYAGYAYAGAGFGESTSDLVFCGYTGVYENGLALSEGERFAMRGGEAVADIDISRLRFHRQRSGSFFQGRQDGWRPVARVALEEVGEGSFATDCGGGATPCCGAASGSATAPGGATAPGSSRAPALALLRPLEPLPFVPTGPDALERLEEISCIQITGVMTRLCAIGCQNLVVGVSGGLDSTLSLLIAVRAFDALNLPRTGIHAVTMPGMGTGARTKTNADRLMEALGVTALEIPIQRAVLQHFADIGQDESVRDVVYENSQARERTQILMDYANRVGGIVLGTGDMSELALGFCTYNGDHMSMYNPNCSVPKTLVKRLVSYLGETFFGPEAAAICEDVVQTPISPELLPADGGELTQRTEDILGDYALHDFFLYHLLDSGSPPDKLRHMAYQAFNGVYPADQIDARLTTFLRRFLTQQFKRNCAPDGPKIGAISLSPRGDLRMPSDARAEALDPTPRA